jgi:hypothetical protein
MIYPLPQPISANLVYDALRVENVRYQAEQSAYVADVFGVTGGIPLPLIFRTSSGSLQRVTTCTITDAEIDAVLQAHPEIGTRLEGGLARAMERLYALLQS